MSVSWESILDDYMEGTRSRDDVERLRLRIDLPADRRAEVNEILRLLDMLDTAFNYVPSDDAIGARFVDELAKRPLPVLSEVKDTLQDPEPHAEDALAQFLEGTSSADDLKSALARADVSDEVRHEIADALDLTIQLNGVFAVLPVDPAQCDAMLSKLNWSTIDDASTETH